MKVGDIVIAPPEVISKHITQGKEYEIIELGHGFNPSSFWIKSDLNLDLFCILENCEHLKGRNWILKNK